MYSARDMRHIRAVCAGSGDAVAGHIGTFISLCLSLSLSLPPSLPPSIPSSLPSPELPSAERRLFHSATFRVISQPLRHIQGFWDSGQCLFKCSAKCSAVDTRQSASSSAAMPVPCRRATRRRAAPHPYKHATLACRRGSAHSAPHTNTITRAGRWAGGGGGRRCAPPPLPPSAPICCL